MIGQRGFTLLELVLSILFLALIAGMAISLARGNADAEKYELTRQKMDQIRIAILGDPSILANGHRSKFGYFGDMGRLPTGLTDLVTQGAQTGYVFDSTHGTGAGWRGPYYTSTFTGDNPITEDAWGNAFVYSTSPLPATLTSLGSDGAAGGSLYAQDLVMQFPTNVLYATVQGFVTDGTTRVPNRSVEVRFPVNGVLTAQAPTATTDANGYFAFANVPFSIASITVLAEAGPPALAALGPKALPIDVNYYDVPKSTFNYFGDLEHLVYHAGSSGLAGATASATADSLYATAQTTSNVKLFWNVPGSTLWVKTIKLNTTTITGCFSTATANGGIAMTAAVPANTASIALDATFYTNSTCTAAANVNVANATFTFNFTYSTNQNTDSITFP